MPQTSDWKLKYRDALLEMEREEKRWRQIEQALRRLIGRLCAAGMGVDPQLDDELVVLAAANRRNADAMELENLAASLTTAVVAVDAGSSVPSVVANAAVPARGDSARAAAGRILQCLRSLSADDTIALGLIARLDQANSDAELAAVLDKTAELIHSHGETLARERLQTAAVLSHVTTRLEEVAGYLTESGNEARSRFVDTASVNDTYGHRAGDRVLQSVATCFMSGLRTEDFAARIGGEEFVILLIGLPFARTLHIADELRRGVEALRFHFRGTPVRVTVSCGLTDLREGDANGAAFDRADGALYRAKHSGKNACTAA